MFIESIRSGDRKAANSTGEVWIKRLDYDLSDNLIYQGVSDDPLSADSDETWTIAKYTYSGDNITLIEYRTAVAWEDRAILNWV